MLIRKRGSHRCMAWSTGRGLVFSYRIKGQLSIKTARFAICFRKSLLTTRITRRKCFWIRTIFTRRNFFLWRIMTCFRIGTAFSPLSRGLRKKFRILASMRLCRCRLRRKKISSTNCSLEFSISRRENRPCH